MHSAKKPVKIAFVNDSKNPGINDSDLLLARELEKYDIEVVGYTWDKQNSLSISDIYLLRSCWNYYEKVSDFTKFVNNFIGSENKKLINHPDLVLWNIKKNYLLDLQKKGISVIPTIILKLLSIEQITGIIKEKNWKEIVLKPVCGTSAYNVKRLAYPYNQGDLTRIMKIFGGTEVVIQPLMKEIMKKGEYALIFINGQFAHSILKVPKSGDFISNISHGGKEKLIEVNKDIVKQAKNILSVLPQASDYARIDGVIRDDKFVLMELELIEPYLFFEFNKLASITFSKHLSKLVK